MKQKEVHDSDWKNKALIDIKTLDQIIALHGTPDFCKIDVEGFETEVLRGLSKVIPRLSFEFTSPEFIEEAIWCVNRLMTIGFTQFNVSLKESLKFEFDEWVDARSMELFLQENTRMKEKWYGDIYARSK
jgi:hypothetical protein